MHSDPERTAFPTTPENAVAASQLGSTITRNAAFTVAGRLFFLVAWAAITPYMLHVLGEERFAIWALFFALTGYFATFDLGLSQALTKYVAQFTAERDERSLRAVTTIGTWSYLALTAPAVVAIAVWREPILSFVRTPDAIRAEAGWTLVGMVVVLGLANVTGVMTAVLAGRQRMDATSRIQLVTTTIQIGGSLAALALGHGLRGLVVAYGVGVLVGGLLSWRAVRSIAPEARLDLGAVSRPLVRQVFHYSAALQIINIGSYLQFQLDKFLLAYFATLPVVARFELGTRIALAAWAVPLLLLPPLIPAVSQLASNDDLDRVVRLYRRASRYLLGVSFPLAAFTIALAPHIGMAWLGPGYPEAAWIAAAMVAYLMVITATGVGSSVIRGIGEPWLEARYHVFGLVTHVVASLLLIPRFGLAGALGAVAISGVLATAYFVARFHARLGVSTLVWFTEAVLRPAIVSSVAALAALALSRSWVEAPASRLPSLAVLGVGALVFAAVVPLGYVWTGVVTRAELHDLGALIARYRRPR